MERETGYQDDDYLTERCRQCGQTVAVHTDDERPDGPWICDSCVRRTVNRAASLSNHIFETAVEMARVRR